VPSLLDLRRRIRAVKSTQQITKAMKAIAASRLRKAQDRILGARPFAQQMHRVLSGVAAQVDTSAHPLLARRALDGPERPILLVVVTADKGLCGGFNTNIIKEAGGVITNAVQRQVSLGLVGRKGRDFFGKRGFDVRFELVNIFTQLKYSHAQAIARAAIEAFTENEVDSVQLVYNEFKSVMQQRVVVDQVLPIRPLDGTADQDELLPEYLYEPGPAAIFDTLIPRHVEIQFYRALLESAAAEHAARLTAMDAASNNATDMIEDLTLYMNKVRQATITREIIEVVSGAEAL
jgi:F-type H+-transporting ATPase subunit gamma|tara:strand:+ start:221 stop:1093 length:873 start_codon:yes stop_codon:yes gene_type:complete